MAASPAAPAALSEILTALDAILEREQNGLEGLLRLDAVPRQGEGRDQGLDYAIADVAWALGVGHELRGFLAALAPHEPTVRALMADRVAA